MDVKESGKTRNNDLTFSLLVSEIESIDSQLRESTLKAINRITTIRNWLIGAYIVEYEQNGKDRAQYGDGLLKRIAKTLNRPGITVTSLQAARLIYRIYPQLRACIEPKYSSMTNILPDNYLSLLISYKFPIDKNWNPSLSRKEKICNDLALSLSTFFPHQPQNPTIPS